MVCSTFKAVAYSGCIIQGVLGLRRSRHTTFRLYDTRYDTYLVNSNDARAELVFLRRWKNMSNAVQVYVISHTPPQCCCLYLQLFLYHYLHPLLEQQDQVFCQFLRHYRYCTFFFRVDRKASGWFTGSEAFVSSE